MRSYQTCRSLLAGLLLAGAGLAAEPLRCPVVADTWVAMHRWETSGGGRADALKTHGDDQELVVRGRESFALLAFDCSSARGMTVDQAVLRIHRRADPVPLHTVGLSTVSGGGPWREAAANFFHPAGARQPWSYPGSDLVDVTFAQGGSLYAYERARDAGGGWWEISVPPALVHALSIGDQYGLLLTDEKGQTQTRHVFSSRESAFPPELLVEGAASDRIAPGPVRSLKSGASSTPEEARRMGRTTLRPGSVILHLGGAGDDQGKGIAASYEIRHSRQPLSAPNFSSAARVPRWSLDPLAPKPHPLATANRRRDEVYAVVEDLQPGATYHFAARAIDEAGNAGPVSALGSYQAYARTFPPLPQAAPPPRASAPTSQRPAVWAVPELLKIHPVTGALLEQAEFPEHRARNSVWNAAASTVRLSGARNEFVAFQLALESAPPVSGIQVRVAEPLFASSRLPEVFRSSGAIQLYREWFVPDERENPAGRQWYPDALVPLTGPVDLPSKDNPVPGQTVQPFFVDVYIPKDAAAGLHRGALSVHAGGSEHRIAIEVEVLPLTLPDKLSFVVDLNCYSGVNSGYQVQRGTPEYRRLEHAYHRMAHLHRANLNVLGYSHSGTTVPDHAPPLEGEGAATRVRSWADWDAHFGPVLDGSLFADLPRASVPVPALYLPFFENWPGDLRRSYRHNIDRVAATEEEYREIITRHALEASPVEEAFSRDYQERYVAVVGRFAGHLRERGWTNTRFQVYFNNKYYYKRPSQGGRGVSWWLLDEPNHRDDVRAISFLASLTRRGLEPYPDVPIILRTDISRVEWIRDLLAGQIDLNCISRRFFEKNRYLMDDRTRFGRDIWNYASTNHPRESNLAMRAWCWRVWLHGGEGLVPWNTVRGAESWERAEPLTVFYPGSKFGLAEPFASLRLKAYRRGQQDLEYLTLLAARRGWDREAVARAVLQALDLSAEVRMESEEDAGSIGFSRVTDSGLETVRQRVVQALLPPPTASTQNPWLFAYFKDSGKSGVYFALSEDGYRWKELNGGKAWIVPQEADELMRDPHLVRGPDGRFHMVWTWGWRTPGLVGYASSEDLVRWSGRRSLAPMAGVEGLRNVWAPEIHWDETKSRWLIIWSSTVDGRFPETAGQVDNALNHRGYVAETADFQTLSPAEVFLDPGYPVIDATLLRVGTKFHMVFKDERRNPLKKHLLSAEGPSLRGPWSGIRGPLTEAWAEGPSLVKIGQDYLLYYDHYQKPQEYRALRSPDLERWEDVTAKLSFPPGARHGSFLEITPEEARRLQDSQQ